MATWSEKNPLTVQKFKDALDGKDKECYLNIKKYLTATAWGVLSGGDDKADDFFVEEIVDETIIDCWKAVNGGKTPPDMKYYLRKALKNKLIDSIKQRKKSIIEESIDSYKKNDNYEGDGDMVLDENGVKPSPKHGYRYNNSVEDTIKKNDIRKVNERIFAFVKKHYGTQIYRMLQVKYDWELSDSDKKKLASIFTQCKAKDCSTTRFLSQELGLTPARILDKINQYEEKLKVDAPKYIISPSKYKEMMTFITQDQLGSLQSSVDPKDEMEALLFSSLVFLQENMDSAQLEEMLQKESVISQLGAIISRK